MTFLLVSLFMAIINFKIRKETASSPGISLLAVVTLGAGALLIIYYEASHQIEQIIFIVGLYTLLTLGAWRFTRSNGLVAKSRES